MDPVSDTEDIPSLLLDCFSEPNHTALLGSTCSGGGQRTVQTPEVAVQQHRSQTPEPSNRVARKEEEPFQSGEFIPTRNAENVDVQNDPQEPNSALSAAQRSRYQIKACSVRLNRLRGLKEELEMRRLVCRGSERTHSLSPSRSFPPDDDEEEEEGFSEGADSKQSPIRNESGQSSSPEHRPRDDDDDDEDADANSAESKQRPNRTPTKQRPIRSESEQSSSSEYRPSDDDEDDDANANSEESKQRPIRTRSRQCPVNTVAALSDSLLDSVEQSAVDGKPKWANKKHFCVYCKKPNGKMARHLEMMHAKEVDVARALNFPKRSKRRFALLEQIRNKGNYHHNLEVLHKGDGEIVTRKRTMTSVPASDYVTCKHCLAFLVRGSMKKHKAMCKIKRKRIQSSESREKATGQEQLLQQARTVEEEALLMDEEVETDTRNSKGSELHPSLAPSSSLATEHLPPADEEDDDDDYDDEESSCDDTDSEQRPKSSPKLTIRTCSWTFDGRRKYDKKHFCLYCKKPNSKMARHLAMKHAKEVDVARALSLPKGSKTRIVLMEQIRSKGNYHHNVEVLRKGDGEIVTFKRPKATDASVSNYLPCPHCLGFFIKSDLWRHQSVCRLKMEANSKKWKAVQSESSRLLPMSSCSSGACQEIMLNMHQDEISGHVKNDPLICKFGDMLFTKRRHNKVQHSYVVNKLREFARFVLAVNELDSSVQYLHQVLLPSRFHLAIEGAKKVSGFDPCTNTYKTPSVAVKLGFSLKRAAEIAVREGLMKGDSEAEAQAKDFIELLETNWKTQNWTSCCAPSSNRRKVNKVDVTTLVEDVVELHTFLECTEDNVEKDLLKYPNLFAWKLLSETLLTKISLFNSRREWVASKLRLETYTNRNNEAPIDPDVTKSLTKLEQELGDKLTTIEMSGREGRKVPILLTERMILTLDLLIRNRDAVGVPKDNPYVFARMEGSYRIGASDCIRKFARDCDVTNPESLMSTELRSHVATLWQILNLKGGEFERLAKLTGPDIEVHTDYHRLTEDTTQLAKICKFLVKMEGGTAASLDEIDSASDVTEHLPPDCDDDNEGSSDETDSEQRPKSSPKPPVTRSTSRPKLTVKGSKSSPKLTVRTCSKTFDGRRKYDNRHFCLYCKKPNSKMARHLKMKHAKEVDVARALSLPKGSKARLALLEQIRKKGDYHHNIEVLQAGDGEIVTRKQPRANAAVSDYLPCPHCLGFFPRNLLSRHMGSCNLKTEATPKKWKRTKVQAASSQLLPTPSCSFGACQEIIFNMHYDGVLRHIKTDPLICKFGDMLFAKFGHDKAQHSYIAQKMRELGRFMLAVKELDSSVEFLLQMFLPSRFDLAIEGAKKVGGFDPCTNTYKTPSFVLKLGYSLKNAAEIAVREGLMKDDGETEAQAKSFIELLETNWKMHVPGHTRNSNWRKLDVIALTEDVVKLHTFLEKAEADAKKDLLASPNRSTWKTLRETLLAKIILFNKRREGEASRLQLETYTNRNSDAPVDPDVTKSLTKLERELGDTLTTIEVSGREGRKVPVLLTERMISSLDLLIGNRDSVGVPKDNPYVFARLEGSDHIRGSHYIRKFTQDCDVADPDNLTSTKLKWRKYVGTLCQILTLNDGELHRLSRFIGHDIRVHTEYHRLSKDTLALAKIGKLLLKMEHRRDTCTSSTIGDTGENSEGPACNKKAQNHNPSRSGGKAAMVCIHQGTGVAVAAAGKKKWSFEEQAAVWRHLRPFISLMKVPGKKDCDLCMNAEPAALRSRTWKDIKYFVYNTIQRKKRT